MLTWDDLSPARQKWVRLVQLHYPEIKSEITYAQIKEIHKEFSDKRSQDKRYKCAFALWLIGPNAISRGVYFFPAEGNIPPNQPETTSAKSELDVAYEEELAAYGIKV